jgi:hypothetical protein
MASRLMSNNRQVGWLATEWTPKDPWVAWMTRLDAAHVRPRFEGLHRLTDNLGDHIITLNRPRFYANAVNFAGG